MGRRYIDPKDRLGVVKLNRHGNEMEVFEYNSPIDILVKFNNTNEIIHTTWLCFDKGVVRSNYDRTVCGIGYIGIGEYRVTINGKYTKQYICWSSMIRRCYDKKFHKRQPTYIDCSVCEEWHNFQNFAKWYDENFYQVNEDRMHLDKDILIKGNKIYSPSTCVFVPQFINCMFLKMQSKRGKCPIGVHVKFNKYQAQCSNENGELIILGRFDTSLEAFYVYKKFKEKVIKNIANKYKNKIPEILYKSLLNYVVEIND